MVGKLVWQGKWFGRKTGLTGKPVLKGNRFCWETVLQTNLFSRELEVVGKWFQWKTTPVEKLVWQGNWLGRESGSPGK